jgi:hypothetical protein
MKWTLLLLAILSLLLIIGCGFLGDDDDDEMLPLEDDLYVWIDDFPHLHRNFDDPPQLLLSLCSKKYYSRYKSLAHQVDISGNSIQVNIDGVQLGGPNSGGDGAFDVLLIGGHHKIDLPEGSYDLSVRYGDKSDLYQITVSEESIITETINTSFTESYWDLYWRFEASTFACFIGSNYEFEDELVELYDSFLDTIRAYDGITEIFYPDSGVTALLSHFYRDPYYANKQYLSSYFQVENKQLLDEIRNKLRDYRLETIGPAGFYNIFISDFNY